ncbi:putative membrane protein YwmF [Bacillus velezensis]|nr:putative membrane protein YwmF [Bacillus velezensis]
MFGFNDMIKFFVSFLIILPMVSVIHVSGHSFMAMLFGGKASLDIGMGKRLLKVGPIQVRRIYFIDSFCKFGELRIDNRLTSALVYSGGCLFNLASIFLINLLIIKDVLEPNLFFTNLSIFQLIMFSLPFCRCNTGIISCQTDWPFTKCSATGNAVKSIIES